MQLREFIKSVLVDIEQGINDASAQTGKVTYLQSLSQNPDNGVEFDVAVTASKEASGKVGAEVFSVGAKGEGKVSQQELSRIKFRVIVGFPRT